MSTWVAGPAAGVKQRLLLLFGEEVRPPTLAAACKLTDMRMVVLPLPRRPKKMYVVSAAGSRQRAAGGLNPKDQVPKASCPSRPPIPSHTAAVFDLPPSPTAPSSAPEGLKPCRSECMYSDTSSSSVFSAVRSTKGLRLLQAWVEERGSVCGWPCPLRCGPGQHKLKYSPTAASTSGRTATSGSQAKILQQVGLAAAARGAAGARRHPGVGFTSALVRPELCHGDVWQPGRGRAEPAALYFQTLGCCLGLLAGLGALAALADRQIHPDLRF